MSQISGHVSISGSFVFGSLPNSKRNGVNFVAECGVLRYCVRNLCISCFQFLPSVCAALIDFIIDLLNDSACEFLEAIKVLSFDVSIPYAVDIS